MKVDGQNPYMEYSNSPEADISLGSDCLIEVKNEPGICDPLHEVIKYYINSIKFPSRNISFLVEIVGIHVLVEIGEEEA